VVLQQKLDNYLRSKGSKDWFTGKKKNDISEEECMEYTDIILSNLPCKLDSHLFGQAYNAIYSAHPEAGPSRI